MRRTAQQSFHATSGCGPLYARTVCFIARLEKLVSSRLHTWHASRAVYDEPCMASNHSDGLDCSDSWTTNANTSPPKAMFCRARTCKVIRPSTCPCSRVHTIYQWSVVVKVPAAILLKFQQRGSKTSLGETSCNDFVTLYSEL
ncbi:hypothetical protein CC86DRAFT_149754 [Ophiobolus disseminans]|uniref:Uncharacterized protein n=1 Tax=Ophiobolus disseminans TaxID=1469910 RepID=A0A6A6ZFC1_9PLEO|nr:hypothetical protein CC86DRAFT_149754 [Ophiobolus disseminans]